MNVLVDTCIWSLAFRRKKQVQAPLQVIELIELIGEGRILMIGPVRQEILSGIREPTQFAALKEKLSAFPDIPIEQSDYENAADYFNRLKGKGIQASNTDFLICAIATRLKAAIFTLDKDFSLFKPYIDLFLYRPRTEGR
jgi:predicted nucleic acid-binding protein